MGIDVEQWRAKIGLWHAFTTGRPLVSRRRCKPFRGISVRRHECKRAFKARQKRRQKTPVRCQFLPFVVVLTLFVVVDSRINTFNNLSCRLTSSRFYPAIRLAATLFLVGSNKYGSMDKRRNAGVEPRSLISQHSVMTVLAMLLILAGDVEVNPGPSKLEASTDLAFLCSLPLGAEWRNLGTRLLVPEHQLNTIQAIHAHLPNHLQDCLNSMFTFWLNNCAEPTCEFLIQAVDAVGRRDVVTMLCLKYYGFVPPTGTSQSGGQFPYQASAHRLPPQQPDIGYQPTPAQSQPLQQGMHGFEHGVQFPQPQQQYHANPQQQQPYLSLPSGQLTGGLSKPTKPQLMKELFSTVASEWHHIGTYLEISDGELNTISEREHGNPTKSLMAMLTVWLQRVSPPASWSDIADAVEVIGRPDIAQQIRQKYCMHVFQQGAQLLQHQQQPQHIQAPNMHPAGQEQLQQLYQHGIHQAPLSHQQPWYLQPQHGVQEPPPGQQRSGYHQPQYDVQHPPPGQQQPAYPQIPNAVQQSHPNQQQLSHPHPQHIAQHPLTGQKQQHTNTQLSSGQFTTEHQATNLGSLPGTSFSGAPNQTSGFPSREEDTPVHISDINSSSQELLSGLQHECSISSNANGASTESSNVLSRHPPFLHLSASEQEELRAMLDDDVREMKRQFGFLVTKTRDSVEERIPVGKYATSILALGAYEPVPEERNQSLLNEHREEIKMAKSTSEIFNVLSAYWNYLNYEILEDTIELYGTSEDKKRLERYNEHLQRFCERRIFELSLPESSSSSSGNTLSSKQKKLAVKLNVCEDIKCNELLRIRSRIAKILHVKLAALIIDGVDAGCVQLTLLIPTFVAQEIFPLSNEQMSALHKDASVIRLECGDYVFENASETSTEDHFTMSLAQEGRKDNAASTDQELSEAADVTDKIDCVNEEDTEECTLELELAQQKEISHFKEDMEPEGGTEPTDSPDEGDLREPSGGYDCTFVEAPPSAFQTECPVCQLLLRDPYQATCCGTNFCQSCIHRVKSKNKLCPTCRKDNFEVFPNKGLKRSIYKLRVFCVHRKDASCPWKGDVWELANHLKEVNHTAADSFDVSDVSEVDSTPLAAQSYADISDGTKVKCTPLGVTDGSKVDSTPLDIYAEKLKSRYRHRSNYVENQWPPQATECFFNLALIKEETVRKGQVSDEFTRMTITGKLDDILRSKVPIELQEVFKKTDNYRNMTVLMEGCPGSGKTALTLHLCLEWADRKLFQEYKLVILVRLREPAIHEAKEIKEILPHVGTEEDAAKELESSHGRGVLFILDGWDELPEGVSGYSTILSIIRRETIPECDVVITSRPTSSASLHNLISSRIEILGFTPGELRDYFIKHLDGNVSQADTLLQKIKENPIVAGTCTLPLNAVILVHIFKCDRGLPSTEHGIFEALIRNCILRHLKEREPHLKIKAIESLKALPPIVQDQYGKLCETAFRGVMEDRIIFKLSEHFNTLGLLQGVECYTSYGTEYFYNFLHLSIQEFLAAQHIATFKPAKQIAEFNKLFSQARFASTFRHYSAITKLATPGIKKILLKIIKRSVADRPPSHGIKKIVLRIVKPSALHIPSDEDKAHLLSLLNCLHEAQEPDLYHLLAENLGSKLDLEDITLNPADCLSINFFLRNATDIELNLRSCSIGDEGVKMLFSQDQVYKLRVLNLRKNQIGTAGAESLGTALKECTKLESLNLGGNKIGPEGVQHLVTVLEKMVQLKELDLQQNNIGNAGAESLGTALKECTKLEYLDLESNRIGPQGCESLSNGLKQCTKLEHLDLGRNQLGDDAIDVISTSLTKLVHLQELYLWGNRISDSSIPKLCVVIKRAKFLRVLNLNDNQFTREGKAKLRKAREERDPDCVELYLSVY